MKREWEHESQKERNESWNARIRAPFDVPSTSPRSCSILENVGDGAAGIATACTGRISVMPVYRAPNGGA